MKRGLWILFALIIAYSASAEWYPDDIETDCTPGNNELVKLSSPIGDHYSGVDSDSHSDSSLDKTYGSFEPFSGDFLKEDAYYDGSETATCLRPQFNAGGFAVRAYNKAGAQAYKIIYLANSASLSDVTVYVDNTGVGDYNWAEGATQFTLYRLEDNSDSFESSNRLGPLSSVTNGDVSVWAGCTDGCSDEYTMNDFADLTPGAYLIIVDGYVKGGSKKDGNKETSDSWFELSFADGSKHTYRNDYVDSWWKGKIYDADDYADLCEYYLTETSYLDTETGQRRCCGDDSSDYGYASDNHVCEEGGWVEKTAEEYCTEQVKSAGNPIYLEMGKTNNEIYSTYDGSDGCCGDDYRTGKTQCYGYPSSCASQGNEEDCNNYDDCTWKERSFASCTGEIINCESYSYDQALCEQAECGYGDDMIFDKVRITADFDADVAKDTIRYCDANTDCEISFRVSQVIRSCPVQPCFTSYADVSVTTTAAGQNDCKMTSWVVMGDPTDFNPVNCISVNHYKDASTLSGGNDYGYSSTPHLCYADVLDDGQKENWEWKDAQTNSFGILSLI